MGAAKVIVGMSGGVDSSVAAWLLKQQGYEVIGVTMEIWQETAQDEENGGCCGLSAVEDARMVAQCLGISHYVMNFRDIFKKEVMDNFASEYERGRTPNPCIVCNRQVKWGAMLEKALALGADYLATGHYARVLHLDNGRYAVARALHPQKDQTYALYNLTQHQLSRTLMPVGAYTKAEIRRMAQELGLPVAAKPDSQDICFVPDGDYQSFLEQYRGQPFETGNFVDKEGRILGRHKGIGAYTIGQRKGLGLAMGRPVFVTGICPERNEVIIGDNEDLLKKELLASQVNLMALASLDEPRRLTAKIRYAHQAAPCTARLLPDGRLYVCFDEPQRAITPGQAVVLYEGDTVAAGGVIGGCPADGQDR